MSTHLRTCNLCEAMCGLVVTTEAAHVVEIKPDHDDPFSRGHICPKAIALQDLHEDPDRLRHPLRRTAAGWERISWDDAFAEITQQVTAIRRAHGRNALAVYRGNPISHNYGLALFSQILVESLRTVNVYSSGSVDQFPVQLASLLMFGHQFVWPVPDIDRTDYWLMLGANPAVSNGSAMTAPGVTKRIAAIRARGGKVVLIDPRRNETAALVDEHHFIRPGADALLLAAMLHTLSTDGAIKLGRLEGLTTGKAAIHVIVKDFAPERVAAAVGIEASTIRRLAREFAAAPTAVSYGRMGTCAQEFGATTSWLINVLNIVTENFDRAGGAMFTTPAVDMLLSRQFAGSYARRHSRVRGLPEFADELPVATLADEIETAGAGQIRGLITVACNTVLSAPNGTRLDRALAELPFMVSIDYYLNETTRHANIILPPLSPFERDHYDVVYAALAVHNVAKYSPAIFAAAPESRDDWEICLEVAMRLQKADGWVGNLGARALGPLLRRLGPRRMLNLMLRFGPYGDRFGWSGKGISVQRLLREPHGIDLGALQPCLPQRLATKDGHIDLAPAVFRADIQRLQSRLTANGVRTNGDLLLIGRRQLRSSNSWMHNWERLVRGRERCTLFMHPTDAAARGVHDEQMVRVTSRTGTIEVAVAITDDIMPGVISLPHGWGHNRAGTRLQIAAAHPGVSLNDIADEDLLDPLSGTAALNGIPATVIPAG